jgi:hypothetical protein
VPEDELGAVATNEQWVELYDRIAALARAHKSTLVFVNTRRLVEPFLATGSVDDLVRWFPRIRELARDESTD